MGATKDNLRSSRFSIYFEHQGPYAIAPPVGFSGHLLPVGNNSLRSTQVNRNTPSIEALHDAVDDLASPVFVVLEDHLPLCILHFLDDDLLGGLGGNTTKGISVQLDSETIADLTVRVQFPPFIQRNLQERIRHLGHNLFELKGLNLPKFLIVGYFQIKIVAKPLPGRRPHGLF